MAFTRGCARWTRRGILSAATLSITVCAAEQVSIAQAPSARQLRPPPPAPAPTSSDVSPISPPPATALVIGNARYAFGPLRNPVNDEAGVAKALRELHFEVEELVNADKATITRAVVAFGQKLKATGGIGFFYFSGHGLQVNEKNYLVPIDAKLEDEAYVDVEAVSADYVLDAMDAAKNSANLMVLDACRDNPFPRPLKSLARGLKQMDAPVGTLIAYATSPGNVAGDGDGPYGVYTGALLAHIQEKGLPIEQVLKRTTNDVVKKTANSAVKQVPWYASSLQRDIILTGFDPMVSIDLAEADMKKGDFAEAAQILASALNYGGSAWDAYPGPSEKAHELLAEASAACGDFEPHVDPSDAMLRVDGGPAVVNNGVLLINPGTHTVEGSRQGYVTKTISIASVAGHHGVLELELQPRENPPPVYWTPWAFMAGGGALLAGAVVTGALSAVAHGRLDKNCPGMACPPDLSFDWQAEKRTGQSLAIASDILLGAGIASAAVGAGLYFLHRSRDTEAPAAPTFLSSFGCDATGCSGRVRVGF
jgi:hypothetical protein